jgi:voltage-gated potassium channel
MDDREQRVERAFEVPMLIAALLVIPVIVVEQTDVGERWRALAGVLNWMIWIAFAVELVVMLAVVRDRWAWLRTHPLEVAVVVLTPPFLPASLQALRVFRLLRLLRLLRVAKLARRMFSLEGVRYAALLAALTALAVVPRTRQSRRGTRRRLPGTACGGRSRP